MKRFAFAAAATLALSAIAAPANAAKFKWTVDYSGFWSDGSALTGMFVAHEEDALDGIVSSDEFLTWMWDWSGNLDVEAFSISSEDAFSETQFDAALNLGADPFVQGVFFGGIDPEEFSIDADFLFVDQFNFETSDYMFTEADQDGSVSVTSQPVPEPATILGLMALAAAGTAVKRQTQNA